MHAPSFSQHAPHIKVLYGRLIYKDGTLGFCTGTSPDSRKFSCVPPGRIQEGAASSYYDWPAPLRRFVFSQRFGIGSMDPFADQNPPILFFPSVYPTYADLGIGTCTSSSAAQHFRFALSYSITLTR